MDKINIQEVDIRFELIDKGLEEGVNVILKNDHPIIDKKPYLEKYLGKMVEVNDMSNDFFTCHIENNIGVLRPLGEPLPYSLIDKVVDINTTVQHCNGLLGLLGKTVQFDLDDEKYVIGAVDLEDYCGGNIVLVKEKDLYAVDSMSSNWDNFRDYYHYEINTGRMIVLEGMSFDEYDWYSEEEVMTLIEQTKQFKEEKKIENKKEESVVMYKVIIKRIEDRVDMVIKVKEEELHQFLVTLVDRYNNSKEGDMILVRDNILFSNEVVSVDVVKEY